MDEIFALSDFGMSKPKPDDVIPSLEVSLKGITYIDTFLFAFWVLKEQRALVEKIEPNFENTGNAFLRK